MRATLGVPEPMVRPLGEFVEAEDLPLTVVVGDDCTVKVVQSDQRQQSTSSVLQAGGWITCPAARELAAKLGIQPRKTGKLLDQLDIRIRACELGCFE